MKILRLLTALSVTAATGLGTATIASATAPSQDSERIITHPFYIRNAHSNKCLEIADGSQANGARAQQWSCNKQETSKWVSSNWGDGLNYQIQNLNSGKCLEVENSSKANGARVQQWTCTRVGGQMWRSIDAGDGTDVLYNAHSGKYLEISNSSKANGARAQLWEGVGQGGAYFTFLSAR
ncbi:RICIN domain-containing protein [Streptomyces sp. NPDC007991]|uniref:RICIN domain-containing protein n=1 Tax=Streptomyces sp. NPDC007991 TaxID=3364803 RepID=UPI0036E459A8